MIQQTILNVVLSTEFVAIRRGLTALLLLLVTCSGSGMALAQEPQREASRFLLLTSKGPILLDLAIQIDRQQLGTRREQIINEILATADKDKDGRTTWREASVDGHFEFGSLKHLAKFRPASFKRRLRIFDDNEDGLVDLPELRRLWELYAGVESLISLSSFNMAAADRYGPLVFALLDEDQDQVLSPKELEAARSRLLSRDVDENELLESQELRSVAKPATDLKKHVPAAEVSGILPVDDVEPEFLLGQLRAAYDLRSKGKKLLQRTVKRLDADGNSRLDTEELAAIKTVPADMVVDIKLGELKEATRPCRLRHVVEQLTEEGNEIIGTGSSLSIQLADLHLQFVAAAPGNRQDSRSDASAMIGMLDRDRNGYLEMSEVESQDGAGYAADFVNWDLNSDDKVVAAEIAKYLEQQSKLLRRRVTLQNIARGRTLWNWLDLNDDGRLSLRELKGVKQRLLLCDQNGDGKLALAELPSTVVVRLLPGSADALVPRRLVARAPRIVVAPYGPKWFIRMDRNGDGDLSRREFLGDEAQFRKLDQDKDGLIDPQEAEKGGKVKADRS